MRRGDADGGTETRSPVSLLAEVRVLLVRARAIPDPFEQAFFTLVHVPYLQPFADVNKRANLCPLSFNDVPERAYTDGILSVYEDRRIEPLRDLLAWAYQRSAEQFRVTREALGQPDPLRLRYREELSEVVREVILHLEPPHRSLVRTRAEAHGVEAGDLTAFTEAALGLLVDLHEGALYRYGLTPSDLDQWRASLPHQEPF